VTRAIVWATPVSEAQELRIFYDRAISPPAAWVIVRGDERFCVDEVLVMVASRLVYDPDAAPPGQLKTKGVLEIES
jgi:hypothetical protein